MASKAGMIFSLLLLVAGYFAGLNYMFNQAGIVSLETINDNQDDQMVIEFECKTWVEDISTATQQEKLISVATFFQNMTPMEGVEGEITVEFSNGQKVLFYIPKTNSNGISSVSVNMSEESFNTGIGRVLISVHLHSFDMVCDSETSFFVWH